MYMLCIQYAELFTVCWIVIVLLYGQYLVAVLPAIIVVAEWSVVAAAVVITLAGMNLCKILVSFDSITISFK